jgi:hypothetical protein
MIMYYHQQKGTIAGNWENRVFSEIFLILFFPPTCKNPLWFSRPWKKQEKKICF